MKTKAKEFSAALARLVPILRKSTMPILTCAKLEAKDGKVTAYATDLDAFGAASCECEGDLEPVCVDAIALHLMVRQGMDVIEVTQKGKRLMIEGNGLAFLATMPTEEFPDWPQSQNDMHLGVDPGELANCIKAVAWASNPHPKITLDLWRECVWVKTSDKMIECCATDGKEFAYSKEDIVGATEAEFMFPASQASFLTDALLTGAESVHITDNWISTESDTFRVAIKKAEGRFIKVQELLQQEQKPIGTFQICQLVDTFHTIKALGKSEPWTATKLQIEKDQVIIAYNGPANQFERALPHKDGEPTTIKLDTERAISVMNHVMPGAKAMISESMLILHDDNCTYALALMRGE